MLQNKQAVSIVPVVTETVLYTPRRSSF